MAQSTELLFEDEVVATVVEGSARTPGIAQDVGEVAHDYIEAQVHPWVPDAWVDQAKTKLSCEIPATRHVFKCIPQRPLAESDAELKVLEEVVQCLLAEATE